MFRAFVVLFCLVVTLPAAAVAQSSEVRLAWDASSAQDITGYVIEYGTSSGVYSQSVNVGLRTEFQIQGLTTGSTYHFAVRAYDGGGVRSTPSNEVVFTPDCSIAFSDGATAFAAAGGGGTFSLATFGSCVWTVGDSADWLTFDPVTIAGAASRTINYTIAVNRSTQPRTAIIYSGNRSIVVVQGGRMRGDFDGDGFNDLIWQNGATGEVSVWQMNGIDLVGGGSLTPGNVGDSNWKIMGTLDADRDGHSDLLFQHDAGHVAIWRMDGATRVENVAVSASVTSDPQWRIVGTGDMDRDDFDDIIWQHPDGRVAVWYMNGLQVRKGAVIATVPGGWRVAGVEDFNDDGKLDLLWRHAALGQLLVWHMDDGQYLSAGMNVMMASSGWQIVATGDFSGDGKADLIWRNADTGELAAWFLGGGSIIGSQSLNPGLVGDSNWRIVGPR